LASSEPIGRVAVTVDLEEYFQVQVMEGVVRPEDWGSMPARIEAQMERLLALLDAAGAKTTWFVVGWIAERYPRLIARLAAEGHELGCHSFWHRRVGTLEPAEFREDTRRAKAAIEAAAGVEVQGYRAPNFSIRLDMEWAWEILAEAGFTYDSSVHPVRHAHYGAAGAPRRPFRIARHGLWELPLATARMARQPLPMAGGAYWRAAPLLYSRAMVRRAARQLGRVNCYLHPWELDPGQPRLPASWIGRMRHYTGLRTMEPKLARMLGEFGCVPLRELYAAELAMAEVPA